MLRLALVAFGCVLPFAASAAASCPVGGSALLQHARKSPLFSLLNAKLGSPATCRTQTADGVQSIVFAFPRGATLEFTTTAAIEAATQSATLPVGMLNQVVAIRALRAVERSEAPPNGCGIAWAKLAPGQGATELVAEGPACNCRTNLKLDGGSVVALGFSLAC